jgi:hypothetical protein
VLGEFGSQLKAKTAKRTQKALAKARTKDSMSAFAKLARVVDGEARIVADPPLIVPVADLAEGDERDRLFDGLSDLLNSYRSTLEYDRRARCWSSFGSSTSRARWSAWEAWALARGSGCCSVATARTRCSCRSRGPRRRCWRSSSLSASSRIMASAWSSASG